MGSSCDYSGHNLHLNEDQVIIEAVDVNNDPVQVGHKADKILATNLHHRSLPLFRYEIDDSLTILNKTCACGSNFKLIEPITGRNEDNFIYHDTIVAIPLLFTNIICKSEGIDEYQIFQTPKGVTIWIVPTSYASPDISKIQIAVTTGLKKIGLSDPQVDIELVDKLKRHPDTGKLKRFVSIK